MNYKNFRKYIPFYIVPIASICLFYSCIKSTKTYDIKNPSRYYTDFFTGNDNSILRGVQFNYSSDEVKKIEKAKLYETTDDHLFYEYSFPKDSTLFSEYANVQYFFDENKLLDIITVDIFVNDSIQEINLTSSITQYFDQRYGKSELDDKKYTVWNGEFEDKKADKTISYSVAFKKIDDDYGIKIEYLRE